MDPRMQLLRNALITLAASLAVVVMLALPGRVGATDFIYDYNVQPVPTTLYWGPLALSHGPSESFTDHILFSTSNPFTAQFIDNFTNFNNFSTLSAALYSMSGPTLVYAATPNTPVNPYAWTNATPSSALAAGSYEVRITGQMSASIVPNPTGESGGIIIAVIPEPETYAMMLAGLGLMGFVARRRKQRNAA